MIRGFTIAAALLMVFTITVQRAQITKAQAALAAEEAAHAVTRSSVGRLHMELADSGQRVRRLVRESEARADRSRQAMAMVDGLAAERDRLLKSASRLRRPDEACVVSDELRAMERHL